MTIFTEKKPSLGEKLLNAPGHLKYVQSTTGPSIWMDNTDIMHLRPSFSLLRTPRLDLRKQHSVNLVFWHWRMAQTISHTTTVLQETSSSANSSVDTFSLAGLQLICFYISTMHCNDWPGAAYQVVEGQLNHITTSITILNKSKTDKLTLK